MSTLPLFLVLVAGLNGGTVLVAEGIPADPVLLILITGTIGVVPAYET